MKATAIAHPNIAFIKYWGKKPGKENERLPVNSSISMPIKQLQTTTTVEFLPELKEDIVILNGAVVAGEKRQRVVDHLNRIRNIYYKQLSFRALARNPNRNYNIEISQSRCSFEMTKIDYKAKVESINNFPTAAGIASSASGFAALTLAATNALELKLSEKQLSILARQGSGSACRSIPKGWVEWVAGDNSQTSYAKTIFPADWWDLQDVIVCFNRQEKEISSSQAMKYAATSPFFAQRQKNIKNKILNIKRHIKERNFVKFGELIEQEAIELHTVIMTQTPSIIYWSANTLELIHHVRRWRSQGLEVYFTCDAGSTIHIICQNKNKQKIKDKIVNQFPNVTMY